MKSVLVILKKRCLYTDSALILLCHQPPGMTKKRNKKQKKSTKSKQVGRVINKMEIRKTAKNLS